MPASILRCAKSWRMSPCITMSLLDDSKLAYWAERRRAVLDRLPTAKEGIDWCLEHTAVVDDTVREVFESIRRSHDPVPQISVVATGGYGRNELAPYSD